MTRQQFAFPFPHCRLQHSVEKNRAYDISLSHTSLNGKPVSLLQFTTLILIKFPKASNRGPYSTRSKALAKSKLANHRGKFHSRLLLHNDSKTRKRVLNTSARSKPCLVNALMAFQCNPQPLTNQLRKYW